MYLLFDIGGTKTRVAVSRDGGTFSEPVIFSTPQGFDDGMALIAETARELAGGEKITAAAGGIPGPLDREKAMVVNAPNLSGWNGKPLVGTLSKKLGTLVHLENDADLAGLGEAVAGAGKGFRIVVYMTISTGIGGTRIVDSAVDTYAFGFEPGHQIVCGDGTLCNIPACTADLEAHIGGNAIQKRLGKRPTEITDEKIWDELARWLALGLHNTIVHWSPDVVVLGGGIMKRMPLDRVEHHLKNFLTIFPEAPLLKKATLGDAGGLHGALALLKSRTGG